MTAHAKRILDEALTLSEDERAELVTKLLATLPDDEAEELHPEWLAEIERRARRAHADPGGGEAWEVVEERLMARFAR